jgi:PBP1b-binding outer membrane lipoprotein LpoB
MSSQYRNSLVPTLALLAALALGGCAQNDPAPAETPAAVSTATVAEPSESTEGEEIAKPVKTPYSPPTKELKGKDPFRK